MLSTGFEVVPVYMNYPSPTAADLRRFDADGFLVVENVIDAEERAALVTMGDEIIRGPRDEANDWDWRHGEPLDKRAYRIVQSGVDKRFPWITTSRLRDWAGRFGAALMRQQMEFWYEQFLGKPPRTGAPTPWHQDEAYWGRTLSGKGITCWTAFHFVGQENGCMQFARGRHDKLLNHYNPPEFASDLLVCAIPDDTQVVACPIDIGSVTFHHSRTPHMTTGNTSNRWRAVLTQHFRNPICKDVPEDNYAWRVKVRQHSDERRAAFLTQASGGVRV